MSIQLSIELVTMSIFQRAVQRVVSFNSVSLKSFRVALLCLNAVDGY